jgi:hypothetical protein
MGKCGGFCTEVVTLAGDRAVTLSTGFLASIITTVACTSVKLYLVSDLFLNMSHGVCI